MFQPRENNIFTNDKTEINDDSIIKRRKLPRFMIPPVKNRPQHIQHHNDPITTSPPQDQQQPIIFASPKAFFQEQIITKTKFFDKHQKDQFISWVSITLLLTLFLFLRSISKPYLHKMAEFRKTATKKSTKATTKTQTFYLTLTAWVYLWITSVTCLTVIPHFSSHYNEIIAASLFFPCVGLTVSALVMGRFVVRVSYYCLKGCSNRRTKKKQHNRKKEGKTVANVGSSDTTDGKNYHVSKTPPKSEIMKHKNTDDDDTTSSSSTTSTSEDTTTNTPDANSAKNSKYNQKRKGKMISFHRPFRKLLKSSVLLSTALCFLYMHCWSSTLGAFKVYEIEHDAGAVCRAVFSPIILLLGDLVTATTDDGAEVLEGGGVDESCIWLIWCIVVCGMLFAYAQDEFADRHFYYYHVGSLHHYPYGQEVVDIGVMTSSHEMSPLSPSLQREIMKKSQASNNCSSHEKFDDLADLNKSLHNIDVEHDDDEEDDLDHHEDEEQEEQRKEHVTLVGRGQFQKNMSNGLKRLKKSEVKERPLGTLEMCQWYNVVLVTTVFDILVQWKIFLGRFDARSMQPALQQPQLLQKKKKKRKKIQRNEKDLARKDKTGVYNDDYDENNTSDEEEEDCPGCVFDCRRRSPSSFSNKSINNIDGDHNDEGYWFDFVADVGDGFNSSYQVARLLAQPQLSVRDSGGKRVLPRGEVLVVGGDLAYPDPSPESYEKRFFRTFEDAMQPPPTFRREHISIVKPALPVQGWSGCFFNKNLDDVDDAVEEIDNNDMLQRYKGPCAYVIPGNHDWYDGLATYSRYILSRDWLGGWLMPQQRSYFALKLPKGWWLLGFDLALAGDIDIEQFKFFANLAAKSIKASDAVIVVTHHPNWVLDADANRAPDELEEENLRELMNHHLPGKVRLRLAGDLHHYTRHIPVVPPLPKRKRRHRRSRSFPSNGKASIDAAQNNKSDPTMPALSLPPHVESFAEKNQPELIVSGGGGAFLHPTHCYNEQVRVGKEQDEYVRVCAFPNEKVCYRLSWLNIWQFRWRNWRLDVVWAISYFGIASSLFPLCGIYADYLEFNPTQHPVTLLLWAIKTVLSLLKQILLTGRISLITSIVVLGLCFIVTDAKLRPISRICWASSHGIAHIMGALACLLFVQCITEWTIYEGIVKVTDAKTLKHNAGDGGIDLASSLYEEYTSHFSHVFDDFSPINATVVAQDYALDDLASMTASERFFAGAINLVARIFTWLFTEVAFLKAVLSIFDLPGNIAENHSRICDILCADDTSCMLGNNFEMYQHIDRVSMISYLGAISLYFMTFAIPFAGNLFGTWLALTLNVFKAQSDGGFSSLRLQHWKNFLKLHIKDNGDLEVYSIGLHRVPQHWVKDPLWDGGGKKATSFDDQRSKNECTPSWQWDTPSKWIPERHSKKFTPEIVDYTRIKKRKGFSFDTH